MNALALRRRTLGKSVYKKTVEGNPAIAQGSLSRLYPGITMQGWTEQKSYDGKNLLPVDVGQEFTGVAATDSATFEEDGVHAIYESIVSGEARDIYMYGDSNLSVESGYVEVPSLTPGDYRIVNDNIGISLYVVVWRDGSSVVLGYADNVSTKITVQDGDKFRIFLRCNISGDTDAKIHPMIVKEGDDTTVYEPYTGEQPSPSPDYPQEITSAGKYNEETQKYEYQVKLTGANLFNPSSDQKGYYAGIVGGALSFNTIIGYSWFLELTDFATGQYTISLDTDVNVRWRYYITDDKDVILALYEDSSANSTHNYRTFELPDGAKKFRFSILEIDSADEATIMFNRGSEVFPYEPYHLPQTVTITSDRPLTKWDKLEKRNGQWGWVYKSAEIVLDGSERWTIFSEPDGDKSFYILVDGLVNSSAFSNKYRYKNGVNLDDTKTFIVGRGAYKNSLWFVVPGFETANDFKTFLESQAQLQDPVIVWYETTEETFVLLSESEQEQMNALYTFRPTTVLSNDCDCNMSLTYKTKKSLEVTA